jgi:SAM-dependent methyltransferase
LGDPPPWHEDEEFWRKFDPWLFPDERWEKAAEEVDLALELLELPEGAAVLDLCCGPGRHSLELARRGYRVTGVDRTGDYLAEGRRRAAEEGLDVEFVCADMREFVRADAFDAVLNLFTSFGYFDAPDDDRIVAANLHWSLRGGGGLLMDVMGREVLARKFTPRDWRERDGALMLEERRIVDDWSRVESRWILVEDGRRSESTISVRLYSAGELGALLRG